MFVFGGVFGALLGSMNASEHTKNVKAVSPPSVIKQITKEELFQNIQNIKRGKPTEVSLDFVEGNELLWIDVSHIEGFGDIGDMGSTEEAKVLKNYIEYNSTKLEYRIYIKTVIDTIQLIYRPTKNELMRTHFNNNTVRTQEVWEDMTYEQIISTSEGRSFTNDPSKYTYKYNKYGNSPSQTPITKSIGYTTTPTMNWHEISCWQGKGIKTQKLFTSPL